MKNIYGKFTLREKNKENKIQKNLKNNYGNFIHGAKIREDKILKKLSKILTGIFFCEKIKFPKLNKFAGRLNLKKIINYGNFALRDDNI